MFSLLATSIYNGDGFGIDFMSRILFAPASRALHIFVPGVGSRGVGSQRALGTSIPSPLHMVSFVDRQFTGYQRLACNLTIYRSLGQAPHVKFSTESSCKIVHDQSPCQGATFLSFAVLWRTVKIRASCRLTWGLEKRLSSTCRHSNPGAI